MSLINQAMNVALINERRESEGPLAKYSSLLHILNGEEEFILNKAGIIISSNLEAVNVTVL